ncbi:hypothetical protein IscW_ISCW007823 [Ixodes scapularis]|uniref:Uncharacterized protein n=1 Tax=Ixodes scapularis TaxID=6945 RepID=B7PW09_IXOSC|nr:hypothetical protein IscW_ISCW007823 [Ixodes scapularis]|eukprot:XP_002408983.1 hypothetical protein IscW_ISCW007823 [Ixodes scapularis]
MKGEKKKGGEVVLETGLSQEDELDCFGRKCLASDQCCRGSACVDVDGSKRASSRGLHLLRALCPRKSFA